MDRILIRGGVPLSGTIAIGGAKNAALPLMAASLLTPDTFVRTTLPGMKRGAAVVHVGPALGAAFTQYTAELEPGGELGSTPAQRFLFVMEGSITLETQSKQNALGVRGHAYIPE